MSNQPENEECKAKKTEVAPATTNLSSKSQDQSSNQTSLNPSTIKSPPKVNDEKNEVELNVLKTADIPKNRTDVNQTDRITNERRESKKPKTLRKLHAEPDVGGLSTEREVVGDDLNKKEEVHILCECEPSVAGAAVPAVISFNSPLENSRIADNNSSKTTKDDASHISEKTASTSRNKNWVTGKKGVKERNNLKDKVKLGHINKEKKITDLDNSDEKHDSNNSTEIKSPKESNQSLKSFTEKASTDTKMILKKPSLIPKLSRASNSNRKDLRSFSKDDAKREKETTSKIFNKCASTSNKIKESKTFKNSPKITNTKVENQPKLNGMSGNTISLKMLSLQERLKATTTMLRQKIDMDRSSSKLLPEQSASSVLSVELDVDKAVSLKNKKPIQDLYANISELKQIASYLLETNTVKGQVKYIEKLYKNVSDIKRIADKIREHEDDPVRPNNEENQNSDDSLITEKEKAQKSPASAKDNKIYIKFMPTRDKKQDGKRKRKDGLLEQSEEVQTDLSLGAKLTSESLNSDTCLTEVKDENRIKETDSMDGVFIPTCEPPKNMEEEEETTGLDITITFPEFNQLHSNGTDSHISVCLSEISAEALGKLKRCPKEFTLRMDFVEGKVLFHSGKGPANNFLIGPDLKFTENYVDNKKSDVINIKPSTECSFTSQLIPVENAKETNSSKTLKSTDSELFNVVNAPLLLKSPYLNPATGHKSCISFKNDKIMSMSFTARQLFKSMPQIPSLTNIFEDQIVDSFNKTAFQIQEKKRKNRQNQKKRISSNTVL